MSHRGSLAVSLCVVLAACGSGTPDGAATNADEAPAIAGAPRTAASAGATSGTDVATTGGDATPRLPKEIVALTAPRGLLAAQLAAEGVSLRRADPSSTEWSSADIVYVSADEADSLPQDLRDRLGRHPGSVIIDSEVPMPALPQDARGGSLREMARYRAHPTVALGLQLFDRVPHGGVIVRSPRDSLRLDAEPESSGRPRSVVKVAEPAVALRGASGLAGFIQREKESLPQELRALGRTAAKEITVGTQYGSSWASSANLRHQFFDANRGLTGDWSPTSWTTEFKARAVVGYADESGQQPQILLSLRGEHITRDNYPSGGFKPSLGGIRSVWDAGTEDRGWIDRIPVKMAARVGVMLDEREDSQNTIMDEVEVRPTLKELQDTNYQETQIGVSRGYTIGGSSALGSVKFLGVFGIAPSSSYTYAEVVPRTTTWYEYRADVRTNAPKGEITWSLDTSSADLRCPNDFRSWGHLPHDGNDPGRPPRSDMSSDEIGNSKGVDYLFPKSVYNGQEFDGDALFKLSRPLKHTDAVLVYFETVMQEGRCRYLRDGYYDVGRARRVYYPKRNFVERLAEETSPRHWQWMRLASLKDSDKFVPASNQPYRIQAEGGAMGYVTLGNSAPQSNDLPLRVEAPGTDGRQAFYLRQLDGQPYFRISPKLNNDAIAADPQRQALFLGLSESLSMESQYAKVIAQPQELCRYRWLLGDSSLVDITRYSTTLLNGCDRDAGTYNRAMRLTAAADGSVQVSSAPPTADMKWRIEPVFPPAFSVQPGAGGSNGQSGASGRTVALSATLTDQTSLPVRYRWLKRSPGAANWVVVQGWRDASSRSVSFTKIGAGVADSGEYAVDVYNVATTGPLTETSGFLRSSSVTVDIPALRPVILRNPADATVVEGREATFTVAASNAATYQWYVLEPRSAAWVASTAPTASTASFKVLQAQKARSGLQVKVRVTSTDNFWVESAAATLVIDTLDNAVIVRDPADVTVAENQPARFSVVATGVRSVGGYQWEILEPGAATWVPVGPNNATGTLPELIVNRTSRERDGARLRVRVVGETGNVLTSRPATLRIDTLDNAVIQRQPVGVSVMEGQPARFSVTATGVAATRGYQWYERAPGRSDWTIVANGTAAELPVTQTPATRSGSQFRVAVRGETGNVVTSEPATLTVVPAGPGLVDGARFIFRSACVDPTPLALSIGTSGDLTQNGRPVILGRYLSNSAPSQWIARPSDEPGYWRFENAQSGRLLDNRNGGFSAGNAIQQWGDRMSAQACSTKFRLEAATDTGTAGDYRLVTRCPLADTNPAAKLVIGGVGTNVGTEVRLATRSAQCGQRFTVERAN